MSNFSWKVFDIFRFICSLMIALHWLGSDFCNYRWDKKKLIYKIWNYDCTVRKQQFWCSRIDEGRGGGMVGKAFRPGQCNSLYNQRMRRRRTHSDLPLPGFALVGLKILGKMHMDNGVETPKEQIVSIEDAPD